MPIKFHNGQKNELEISKSLKSILLDEIRIRRSGKKLHSSNSVKVSWHTNWQILEDIEKWKNWNPENETLIHLFYPFNQTKYATECFHCVPDNKESFEITNHLHLIFTYYLFKIQFTRKISPEELNKSIIKIYSIQK